MSILFPVAETPEQALFAPRGHAVRAREAGALAGGAVAFEARLTGPAYRTLDAALDAYAGRVEDERPGRLFSPPVEARWCELKAVAPDGERPPPPAAPTLRDGRRWPAPPQPPAPLLWRLSVRFWRIGGAEEALPELPPARRLRREGGDWTTLDARALRSLAAQPLRPFRPQQPLDEGLFEVHPPDAPDLLIPDE